ncbi:hypothetical protein BDZ45DRAFT_781231 [Acephala macrosclerotiorum]|nr:hypothetical protein BDZ45DRAFT_781231 [Acephala macrosclerotiorum]
MLHTLISALKQSSDPSEPPSSSPSADSQASSGSSSKALDDVSIEQYRARKDKEDKEKRRRERQEPRTTTPPLPAMFRSPIVPTQDELYCANKEEHQLGVYCPECRAIKMPWGNQVPFVEGHTVGAEGTILAGVPLQNHVAIAVVSVTAFLHINHQPVESIIGLSAVLERYSAAAEAGQRVAHLVDALVYDAEHPGAEDDQEIRAPLRQVSPWYSILNSILEEPWMTQTQFHERATTQGQDRRLPGQPSSYVNATMQTLIVPQRARTPPASSYPPDTDNGDGGDSGDGDAGNGGGSGDIHGDPSSGDPCNGSGGSGGGGIKAVRSRGIGTSRGPQSSSARGRRHQADDGDNAELIFQPREIPEGTKAQAPAARGHKFFMFREDTANKGRLDVRIYPHIQEFNWYDQLDISALNKARDQWMRRTKLKAMEQPLPWTETEKDFLKTLVERELALPGVKANKVDWEKIAKDLNENFDGVTQEAGTRIARTSKLNDDGSIVHHRKTFEKLKKDQVGNSTRSKIECKSQARKFGDIKKLLNESLPDNKRKHGLEDEDEEEAEVVDDHTTKRRRGNETSSEITH